MFSGELALLQVYNSKWDGFWSSKFTISMLGRPFLSLFTKYVTDQSGAPTHLLLEVGWGRKGVKRVYFSIFDSHFLSRKWLKTEELDIFWNLLCVNLQKMVWLVKETQLSTVGQVQLSKNGGAIFAEVSWSKLLLITVLVSYKLHQRALKSRKRGQRAGRTKKLEDQIK